MSTFEIIMEDLKALPPAKLEEVAVYVHRLLGTNSSDRDAILRETSGIFSASDGEAIEKAINETCEKIDASDW